MIQAFQNTLTASMVAYHPRFKADLLYRKQNSSHALYVLAMIFLCCVLLGTKPCAAQEWDREVVRYVGEVAIGTEYSRTDQVVLKWSEPARLSVFNGTAREERVVGQVVEQINQALDSTEMSIDVLAAEDKEATLKVIFTPYAKFKKVASEHGFEAVPNNIGGFYIWWNHRHEIERAVVLLSNDQLKNRALHHFTLEEISQSLGFAGDSARFEKSVFYENEEEFGDAVQFSPLDKKLMCFIYTHVEAGTPPVELGLIMSEHWEEQK